MYRATILPQTHVLPHHSREPPESHLGLLARALVALQVAHCSGQGHVARMNKSRLPKHFVLLWIPERRVAGGQEMTYGRSLQRHLAHFSLPAAFTDGQNFGPCRMAQARDRAPLQSW